MVTSIGAGTMRHSKSIPENTSKKLSNKWPSMATDSGISLLSTDTLGKYREVLPGTRSLPRSEALSTTVTPIYQFETKQKIEEESLNYR